MRTFPELRAHLLKVTGQDVAADESRWYRFNGTGGWVREDAIIEDDVEIGEDAAVYGPRTHLCDKTKIDDQAVIGPHIMTQGCTVIGGSAHVTGEMRGQPLEDDFYILNDANITGKDTWICRSNLIDTIVDDGAWIVQSLVGAGYVSGPGTILAQCDAGECIPPDVQVMGEDPDLPPDPKAKTVDAVQWINITHGAQLTNCHVQPGVYIDRPVYLSDRVISKSDPAITRDTTLIDIGLGDLADLDEVDFTASREGSRVKAADSQETKRYIM